MPSRAKSVVSVEDAQRLDHLRVDRGITRGGRAVGSPLHNSMFGGGTGIQTARIYWLVCKP